MGTRTGESYLYNVGLTEKAAKVAAKKRTVKATKRLKGGQEVAIVQGDLTADRSDAVVNAANVHLRHTAGLARALADAGGPSLQAECDAYIKKHKEAKTGAVVWSNPGKLPCKVVLHAVGPVWHGGDRDEATLLGDCVRNCLAAADKKGLTSIAIPAIGSGIFGFPRRLCAQVILRAVYDYCWSHKGSLRKVSLTNHDADTVETFLAVLKEGYESWGPAVGLTLTVRYALSDITLAVPSGPTFLVHFVAVGRKWTDKGVMAKLTKAFGADVRTRFDAEGSHDLGAVSILPLKGDVKGMSLCSVFALTKGTLALDYDAAAVGLKAVAAAARKARAAVHIEKPHTPGVDWPRIHAILPDAFPALPTLVVHTNHAHDQKKYNLPDGDGPAAYPTPKGKGVAADAAVSSSAAAPDPPPAKRRKADHGCTSCGVPLAGARLFCAACGAKQD